MTAGAISVYAHGIQTIEQTAEDCLDFMDTVAQTYIVLDRQAAIIDTEALLNYRGASFFEFESFS